MSSLRLPARESACPPASACWRRRDRLGVDLEFGLRRARHLRALPDRSRRGRFAKHGDRPRRADHVTPWSAVEQRYVDKRGRARRRPPARLPGAALAAISSSTCRRKPGPSPGRAQARRDPSDRNRSGRAAVLCRGRRARHARSLQRSAAPADGAAPSNGGSARRAPSLPCCAVCRRPCAPASGRSRSRCARAARSSRSSPGFADRAFGVAFDIGSTTIAAHLCDLESGEVLASAGAMNPQIRFGEDLMSRVSYVMMNPGGEAELTQSVRAAVDALIGEVAGGGGRRARRRFSRSTVVGNPIMHHLFLGLDPTELGGAPFALTLDGGYEARAARTRARHRARRLSSMPCPASPAMSAPTRPASRSPKAPYLQRRTDADRRRRHQRRNPVWRPATACSPAPRRPARRSRARRSPAASAPRPARSSACGSTARRWSRASR